MLNVREIISRSTPEVVRLQQIEMLSSGLKKLLTEEPEKFSSLQSTATVPNVGLTVN